MVSGAGLTSSIVNGDGTGTTNIAGDTNKMVGNGTATGTATNWTITPTGENFIAQATSGNIQAVRAGGGGNSNFDGSNFTSSLSYTLGVGETADYTFNLTYLLEEDNGGPAPEISWQLTHVSSSTTFFTSNTDTTATGANESITELTGSLTLSGEYRLDIIGAVGGASGNNKTSFTTLVSTEFELSNSVIVPEPTSSILALFGAGALSLRRKRS